MTIRSVFAIDSHTAGEPTRVVVQGGPDLGAASLPEKLALFREQFDAFRSAVVNEPRGCEAVVGALLLPPSTAEALVDVIFFNNVGYLGMCVHGTIGVVATLAYHQALQPGTYQMNTPVGQVQTRLHADGRISVKNVPSYRWRKEVVVPVAGHGPVTGDVAWGGNWFFLTSNHGQQLHISRREQLTSFAWEIRQSLRAEGVWGANGQEIDHIELFGPPAGSAADSRNFVLCPGKAYDRSPCGTGTSAKIACLAADGLLAPGQVWRQESIIGSQFEGTYAREEDRIIPEITGRAFVTAETRLLFAVDDPFRDGIESGL